MSAPFLKTFYKEQTLPALMKSRKYANIHQVPKVEKIVLNSGISATADKSVHADTIRDMSMIAGQQAVPTKAKKSIANFKLREGMPIGAKVTLRGDRMYDFLYRLISISIPTVRDFRGLSSKMDGNGNYSIGISDLTIFPEIAFESHKQRVSGMDITIVTTAKTDPEANELLSHLGMPFRRSESSAA
ncbi:MAG: 50S ribosomal protein L5 [Opitutaceae bacterium]|nr:50S ribosomal protein L5 [Opitutaceae bacterium]